MLYDILEEDWIEEAPDVVETRQKAAKGSNAFLASLQAAVGTGWPCGHLKTAENTHTVAGEGQCKTCRRKRWNDAVKRAVRSAEIRAAAAARLAAWRDKSGIMAEERIEAILSGDAQRIPLSELKHIVSARFKMTAEFMFSDTRVKPAVRARSIVIEVLYRRGLSYPRIASLIGRTDHSTIIHARKMFPIYCERDPKVLETFLEVADR